MRKNQLSEHMNQSMEPGKTGDKNLDNLLSQANQEPLHIGLEEINAKVNQGSINMDNAKTNFRFGNQTGLWRLVFVGASIIAVVALIVIKFLPVDKKETTIVAPVIAPINNQTPTETTNAIDKASRTTVEKAMVEKTEITSQAAENTHFTNGRINTEGTATVKFLFDSKPIAVVLNSVKVFEMEINGVEIPEEEFTNHSNIINQAYAEAGIKHRDVAPFVLEREVLTKKLADVIEKSNPSLKDSSYILIITATSSKLNNEEVDQSIHQSLITTYEKATGHVFAAKGRIRIVH